MPIFKKKAAKKEAAMDQKKDSKSDLAMAVATSRFAHGGRIADSTNPKSKLKGIHQKPDWEPSPGKSYAGSSTRAANTSPGGRKGGGQGAHEEAVDSHREVLSEMRSMKKPNLYAEGGEVHCHDGSCYADGGMVCGHPYSIPEVLRCKFMAAGGLVSDPHDQIEHSNYFDELNQDIANEPIYEDDAEHEPRDSNEMGDKLADEDMHGKSIFKKIKMKKAQPGDRGNY